MENPTCRCGNTDEYDLEFGEGGCFLFECLRCGHRLNPIWPQPQTASPRVGRPRVSEEDLISKLRARGINVTDLP